MRRASLALNLFYVVSMAALALLIFSFGLYSRLAEGPLGLLLLSGLGYGITDAGILSAYSALKYLAKI